ncbi:MAG: hypothetical protein AAF558_06035 [Verrucomicrobiota bacterium]
MKAKAILVILFLTHTVSAGSFWKADLAEEVEVVIGTQYEIESSSHNSINRHSFEMEGFRMSQDGIYLVLREPKNFTSKKLDNISKKIRNGLQAKFGLEQAAGKTMVTDSRTGDASSPLRGEDYSTSVFFDERPGLSGVEYIRVSVRVYPLKDSLIGVYVSYSERIRLVEQNQE